MRAPQLLTLVCIIAALQSCKDTPVVYPEGGYEYPKKVEDSNNYWYPVRDSFPKMTNIKDPYEFLMPFYDEPNISLAPKPNAIFRLITFGFGVPQTVIILTQDNIIIKKAIDMFWLHDTLALTYDERVQYQLLRHKSSYKKIMLRAAKSFKFKDSLLKLYPRIFEEGYYDTLNNKANHIRNKAFHYTITKKSITHIEYNELVDLINKSEYWTAPLLVSCESTSTDGWGFLLEANTPKKYNFLFSDYCHKRPLFDKACYQLIKAAGLSKDFWGNN